VEFRTSSLAVIAVCQFHFMTRKWNPHRPEEFAGSA
jgi:hypothetical protein